jgi:hypothetical protein
MRAIRSAVVLTSLLVAGAVSLAGTGTKDTKATPTAPARGSGSGSGSATGSGSGSTADVPTGNTPAPPTDLAMVKPDDMPTDVRMRRLEQKTQALKERAWQLKARVQMLKEQMLGGGVGAQALVTHANDMGAAFRLTKLI